MAVVITPDSELGKEIARWNKPWVFQRYPAMLYQARRLPNGKVSVGESDDRVFGVKVGTGDPTSPGVAEQWSGGCQKVVRNEDEYLKAKGQGWFDSPTEALEGFEAEARKVADVAAHRHYEDKRLSDKAQAEAKVVDDAAFGHVPAIPETPKRKRGRPPKALAN